MELPKDQLREECPGCGSLLVESLQNRRLSPALLEQKPAANTIQKPSGGLSTDFQIAHQQVESSTRKLTFDIEKLDSLLSLSSHGSICIIGEPRYTQLLIDRLCIHSMLPRRHGGIGEGYSKIVAIDAGNSSDVYQVVNFARQYVLDIKRVLQNVSVSRAFTIYQLAHLVNNELPLIIEQLSADKKRNYVIVIYGLLQMFMSDPHIDKRDAKKLVKEISGTINKISEDRFVAVSFNHGDNAYEKSLFPFFDRVIKISNNSSNGWMRLVDIKVGGRMKSYSSRTIVSEPELCLVPER